MNVDGSRIVTLTSIDLDSAQPALRLRLQEKSKELGKKRNQNKLPKKNIQKVINWLQNLLTRAEDEIALDYDCDAAKTERNKDKLREYFKKMRDHMNEQEEDLLNEMDSMTPEQQEETLVFWSGVSKFVVDIFDWIKKTFEYVFEKVKAGFKLVKEAVQGFFKSVMDLLKSVF